jgi:hypothetical protein
MVEAILNSSRQKSETAMLAEMMRSPVKLASARQQLETQIQALV